MIYLLEVYDKMINTRPLPGYNPSTHISPRLCLGMIPDPYMEKAM